MKKFLRFELSGLTFIFWYTIFIISGFGLDKITLIHSDILLPSLFGSFAIALPLGNMIHQITITLFSPYRERRRPWKERKTVGFLKELKKTIPFEMLDKDCQALLVLRKSTKITLEIPGSGVSRCLDVGYIRQEIENRYSYYYVRLENGLLAPALAFPSYCLTALLISDADIAPIPQALYWPGLIMIFALAIGITIAWYIPRLLNEAEDLELCLLNAEEIISTQEIGSVQLYTQQ